MGAWVIRGLPLPSHEPPHHAEGTSKLTISQIGELGLMAGGSQGPIAYSRPEAPNYIATELPPAGQLGIQL